MNCDDNEDFGELFYELRFYGYFLSTVDDAIKDCLIDIIDEVGTEFSQKLTQDKEILKASFNELKEKYKESLERSMPKIHASVKQCLGINKSILHPNDEIYRNNVSEAEEEELIERLAYLNKRCNALRWMKRKQETLLKQVGDYEKQENLLQEIKDEVFAFKNDN